MNPLMITFTFLSLMSLVTVTTTKRFFADSISYSFYNDYLASTKKIEEAQVKEALNDTKLKAKGAIEREDSKKRKKSSNKPLTRFAQLQFDLSRPPNNARCNFYLIFFENDSSHTPQGCESFEIAARLLRRLYGTQAFFNEIPHAEYRILEALAERKEEMEPFLFVDELACLNLQDEKLQKLFVQLLKGGDTYPSLLNYIGFDKKRFDRSTKGLSPLTSTQKKINLFFAPEELLEAVFRDCNIVKELLEARAAILDKAITYELKCKNKEETPKVTRTALSNELSDAFAQIVRSSHLDETKYKHLFDFTLGKIGNILFLEDPKTHLVRREKIQTPEITLQRDMLKS